MSNSSKKCSKCGQVKSLDDFTRNRRMRDGLQSACRECRRTMAQEWRDRNPDNVLTNSRRWRAANPDKQREMQRRYVEQNRARVSASKSRYAANNPDKVRAAKREWSRRNVEREREKVQRRRARLRKASIFVVTDKDLRRLSGAPCVACGAAADSTDHLLPLSRGGHHSAGNLAPMCQTCNSSKGAKTITEWRKANDWLPLGSFPQRKDRADGAA